MMMMIVLPLDHFRINRLHIPADCAGDGPVGHSWLSRGTAP
jgi:hypothetical protein